jgi:hypothetical protein
MKIFKTLGIFLCVICLIIIANIFWTSYNPFYLASCLESKPYDSYLAGNYKKATDEYIAELVWHSTKEYLAHRLFKSIEQLESLLHKLLNEGELIIKWGRKLKNKGNAVNAI